MNRKQHGNFRPQTFKSHERKHTVWMATHNKASVRRISSYEAGQRERSDWIWKKKRLVCDTYFRLGITWKVQFRFNVYVESKKPR